MNRLRRMVTLNRRDERGVETMAMIIVLPVLCVLIFALLDIGVMVRTRIAVENVARDAARRAASDGGNYNPRTNTYGRAWDSIALSTLYRNGKCTESMCTGKPTVSCTTVTPPSGASYHSNVVRRSGDLVTCAVYYPYKAINKPLLDSGLGMGLGKPLGPFTIKVSARAETGTQG